MQSLESPSILLSCSFNKFFYAFHISPSIKVDLSKKCESAGQLCGKWMACENFRNGCPHSVIEEFVATLSCREQVTKRKMQHHASHTIGSHCFISKRHSPKTRFEYKTNFYISMNYNNKKCMS